MMPNNLDTNKTNCCVNHATSGNYGYGKKQHINVLTSQFNDEVDIDNEKKKKGEEKRRVEYTTMYFVSPTDYPQRA